MELIVVAELPPHMATKAQKLTAHRLAKAAVTRGELVRPVACPRCGTAWTGRGNRKLPIHAHHEDYAKPLDVVWLCHSCHLERHREIRRGVLAPRVCAVCDEEFHVSDARSKICGRLTCVWELQRRNSLITNRRNREERFRRLSAAWLLVGGSR